MINQSNTYLSPHAFAVGVHWGQGSLITDNWFNLCSSKHDFKLQIQFRGFPCIFHHGVVSKLTQILSPHEPKRSSRENWPEWAHFQGLLVRCRCLSYKLRHSKKPVVNEWGNISRRGRNYVVTWHGCRCRWEKELGTTPKSTVGIKDLSYNTDLI